MLYGADVFGSEGAIHVHSGHTVVQAGRAGAVGGGQRGRALLKVPRLVSEGGTHLNDPPDTKSEVSGFKVGIIRHFCSSHSYFQRPKSGSVGF